jgi:predicted TIM-barrel fold metal-dependent hydrolase
MTDPRTRGHELIAWWDAELRREIPAGQDIFDAHVHLGTDIDGMRGDFDEMTALFDTNGISRCFFFCMDEPDRVPAFRAANDRTLAFAERSEGRFIPFCRLDLADSPHEEAERSLDLGARGIKLHPRAQRFDIGDQRLEGVFAIAAERRVPILIHAGRGMPPIADELGRLIELHPEAQLILAHCGIADMGRLADRVAGHPSVFFDTSAWNPFDLLDFYRLIPPEQVLYASDYPYGQQPSSLLIAVRTALASGFDEAQLRAMLAGTAHRIADGEPTPAPTRPAGSGELRLPLTFARIHSYLTMATPLLWTRQTDVVGALGLAYNACGETTPYPHDLERVRDLIAAARALWEVNREIFRLLHIANIVTCTPRE